MSSDEQTSLTVAEAVPLGTVYLQQLFHASGIRALAIKGPAFVAVGVRRARRSNDVDLLIHPDDRIAAHDVLEGVGWRLVSVWVPTSLNDTLVSDTYRHDAFPVTLDLHRSFPGLLSWPRSFETMWLERQRVSVAGQEVDTLASAQALVLEALNAMKGRSPDTWSRLVKGVLAGAEPQDTMALIVAAEELGATHSAATLLSSVGAAPPAAPNPAGYEAWLDTTKPRKFSLTLKALARDPLSVPMVLSQEVLLSEEMARFWANRRGIPYRSRRQVFVLRALRRLRGEASVAPKQGRPMHRTEGWASDLRARVSAAAKAQRDRLERRR